MTYRQTAISLLVTIALAASLASAAEESFPTFGIALTPPLRTDFDLTSSEGNVALYRFEKSSKLFGAAVCIEIIPSGGQTAEAVAQSMVKEHGAALVPGDYLIAGERAVKVSGDFATDTFKRRVTYIVVHGRWAYMISAYNTDTADVTNIVDTLLPTVKFFPPEALVKHLEDFGKTPWTMFGVVSMRLPACLRKFDWEEAHVSVGARDFSVSPSRQPYSIDVRNLVGKPVKFADFRDQFSAAMEKNLNLAPDIHLVWHAQPDLPEFNVCDEVKTTAELPNGKAETGLIRIGLLELAPGRFVQFIFSSSDEPTDDGAVFSKVTDRIIKSVKPVKEKTP